MPYQVKGLPAEASAQAGGDMVLKRNGYSTIFITLWIKKYIYDEEKK